MKKNILLLLIQVIIFNLSFGQNTLFQNFQYPPQSAKPVVWWHWVGGNVTKEGITKDLEWMQRVGIGGFQAFDVSIGGGQTIEKKVKYMTPEWLELIRHTAAEADRLGLEMTMVTAAGWSETGGTWVKPNEAMKKLVWSKTQIVGGTKYYGKLPMPPKVAGPIRNMPKGAGFAGGNAKSEPFYQDQIVLAYKTPDADLNLAIPKIMTHKGAMVEAKALLDDDLTSKITLETPTIEQPVYLQFEYEKPFTARSFCLALGGGAMFPSRIMRAGYVQASEDGKDFKTLFALPGPQHDIRALPVRTYSFPAITAKYFRVVFIIGATMTTVGGPDDVGGFGGPTTAPKSFDLAEAIFSSSARVNRWEDKAAFAPMFAFESLKTPKFEAETAIKSEEIIDLTSNLKADGTIEWDVPIGNWTVLRMGQSQTGAKNGPAMPEATGYEVDKFNKTHLLTYLNQWANPIAEVMGSLYGKSMKYFLVDSYEADAQNWTETMLTEFKKRRDYDPTKYLPALAGFVVDNSEVSDRFLWDFRLTIAELLVDNHYAAITEYAHQKGIKTYGEVAGISMPIIEDALRNKASVDIPMGEFGMTQGLSETTKDWVSPYDLEQQKAYVGASDRLHAHQSDVREAASAAHIYGKKIVAAEAWTGGGYEAPAALKFIGDYWLTQGINQVIFHTFAHQPLDTKPGNTMVGTHFNRNITWAEQAKPFIKYLTRTQYMLQEGRSVADIAYYLGEDIPAAVPYWEKLRNETPAGYDYDFVNTEILQRFEVENGELILPSGMRYKLLVLPEKNTMTPHVLAKIEDLLSKGATIVGPKPEKSPSLVGYPAVDNDVATKANALWGLADGKFIFQNTYGKGKIFWNTPLQGILSQMNLKKDVDYTLPHINTRLSWIHRKTADADFYFLLNMRNQKEDMNVVFRAAGKTPTLWRADKGTSEPLSYKVNDGLTTVKLHLEPQESVFVVFDKNTSQTDFSSHTSSTLREMRNQLEGSWTLSFPTNWGAPQQITLNKLISWTAHPDEGVQFFSGTATYTNHLNLKKAQVAPNASLWLDLGEVKDIAEVVLNGIVIDTLWKYPYRVEITKAVKIGENKLEIKVTNQWDNRMAGDAKLPTEKKILKASGGMRFGGSPKPKTSGLLGPVAIIEVK